MKNGIVKSVSKTLKSIGKAHDNPLATVSRSPVICKKKRNVLKKKRKIQKQSRKSNRK